MEMQPDGTIVRRNKEWFDAKGYPDYQVSSWWKKDNTFGDRGLVIYVGIAGKDDYAFGVTHDVEGNIFANGYITKEGKDISLFVMIPGEDL